MTLPKDLTELRIYIEHFLIQNAYDWYTSDEKKIYRRALKDVLALIEPPRTEPVWKGDTYWQSLVNYKYGSNIMRTYLPYYAVASVPINACDSDSWRKILP